MPLAFAPFGKEVEVVSIKLEDKTKRHLESLGITVGSKLVSMFDNRGDVIVKVLESKLALNKSLASKIMVK